MPIDLSVKYIGNVYYVKTEEWQRSFFAPRMKDGVVFVLDGINEYSFPSGKVRAQKNDIIVLPGEVPYSGKSFSGGKFEGIVIDFISCEEASLSQLKLPYVISVEDKKQYELLFREIVTVWENKYADSNLHIKSLLYKLIYKLFRELNGISNDKIPAILEYINANLSNRELSVTRLCKEFFVSESTIMRGVRKLTGYTANEYINLQRLEKAREYILIGEKSIKEIALLCGFSSPYYFSNVFKKKYGCSPRYYRDMLSRNNGGNKFD